MASRGWLKPDFWLCVTLVLFPVFRVLKISVMLLPVLYDCSENDFLKTLRGPKLERCKMFSYKLENEIKRAGPYSCSWLLIPHVEENSFSN